MLSVFYISGDKNKTKQKMSSIMTRIKLKNIVNSHMIVQILRK